ncbi:cupin domain-containing protein [Janibacter sp. YIM B02568]|uniref:cupin domain-containing protein n=1 Tax=Janibacter endophyticus TaxID=2806261 RepID=UPI00194F35B8|nr:cupin domain-containing protein [Janibacter endophyticus]MBM6544800.1 cupin domain-containing protein [Janibacter endophyticus]
MTISSEPTDQGPKPYVVNIERATLENSTYRTTLWTGKFLQMTVMAIAPGDDIGLEVHEGHDQFLRVESGEGKVQMGPAEDQLTFERTVGDDEAILVPAGSWHNVTNVGTEPLKVYSIYGPPEHEHGTVHQLKSDDPEH